MQDINYICKPHFLSESIHTTVESISPVGKKFLCDQNLELPLFLRPIFVNFSPSLEKF